MGRSVPVEDSFAPNEDRRSKNEDSSRPNEDSSRPNEEGGWLKDKIMEVAGSEWRSLKQLADLTGKSRRHLINRVIPELIAAGKLQRRYAAAVHPQQAYLAITTDKLRGAIC